MAGDVISLIVIAVCGLSLVGGLLGLIVGPDRSKALQSVLFGAIGLWIFHSMRPMHPHNPSIRSLRLARPVTRPARSQEQLVDYYQGVTDAKTSCKQAARKLARYGDADLPFFAFESYFPIAKSAASGKISLVEDDANIKTPTAPCSAPASNATMTSRRRRRWRSTPPPNSQTRHRRQRT
jgi:hypothetical protein